MSVNLYNLYCNSIACAETDYALGVRENLNYNVKRLFAKNSKGNYIFSGVKNLVAKFKSLYNVNEPELMAMIEILKNSTKGKRTPDGYTYWEVIVADIIYGRWRNENLNPGGAAVDIVGSGTAQITGHTNYEIIAKSLGIGIPALKYLISKYSTIDFYAMNYYNLYISNNRNILKSWLKVEVDRDTVRAYANDALKFKRQHRGGADSIADKKFIEAFSNSITKYNYLEALPNSATMMIVKNILVKEADMINLINSGSNNKIALVDSALSELLSHKAHDSSQTSWIKKSLSKLSDQELRNIAEYINKELLS